MINFLGVVGLLIIIFVVIPIALFLYGYMFSSGATRGYFDSIKSTLNRYGKKQEK